MISTDIHGHTDVILHRGTVIRDPNNKPFFGVTFLAVAEADRPRHKADRELCERLACKMTKAECKAFLEAAGRNVYVDELKRDLALRVAHVQMDAWWPWRIVRDENVVMEVAQ